MGKLLSIRTYARQAYCSRYGFARVTIDAEGKMLGHWSNSPKLDPVKLGHIGDCSTRVNDHKTGLCFHNRDFLVYTFALPRGLT